MSTKRRSPGRVEHRGRVTVPAGAGAECPADNPPAASDPCVSVETIRQHLGAVAFIAERMDAGELDDSPTQRAYVKGARTALEGLLAEAGEPVVHPGPAGS